MGSSENQTGVASSLRFIPLSYIHADSHASALRLILTINPHWEGPDNHIDFVRFTDGITNTVGLSIFAVCRIPLANEAYSFSKSSIANPG